MAINTLLEVLGSTVSPSQACGTRRQGSWLKRALANRRALAAGVPTPGQHKRATPIVSTCCHITPSGPSSILTRAPMAKCHAAGGHEAAQGNSPVRRHFYDCIAHLGDGIYTRNHRIAFSAFPPPIAESRALAAICVTTCASIDVRTVGEAFSDGRSFHTPTFVYVFFSIEHNNHTALLSTLAAAARPFLHSMRVPTA